MDIRHLKYFVTTVKTGSFKQAAEELCISQPAVSKAIKDLEEELGTPLLIRGARGVEITELGNALFHRAKAALTDLDNVKAEIKSKAKHQTLAIGTTAVPAAYFLPQVIPPFTARYPNIHLQVIGDVVDTVISRVVLGELAFAIAPINPALQDSGLIQRPLFDAPIAVLCSAQHPLASQSSITHADLLDHPWIVSLEGTRPNQDFKRAFEAAHLPAPKSIVNSDNHLLIRSLLMKSRFLSLTPTPLYHNELVSGQLAQLPITMIGPQFLRYGLIYRQHTHISEASQNFWRIMKEVAVADYLIQAG
ncbi:LysR family transcriptional regulator [Halioxenophilus sp. WMMB6]|uniref:LysR family transcriptional regulator n=1 Tax=Halioxenophilus sp. WMMB6 TaxID=3073815 RepID=UPI00295EA113|nr:LysR family transcriptional regulator [Halioxenophilus sp. WMMB6]